MLGRFNFGQRITSRAEGAVFETGVFTTKLSLYFAATFYFYPKTNPLATTAARLLYQIMYGKTS